MIHKRRAASDPRNTASDQLFNFLGRFGTAFSKGSDFASHHRKSSPLLSSTRRLNCGVQRENVGLKGNAVYNPDDLIYLLAALIDFLHRLDYFADDTPALRRDTASTGR